MVAEERLDQRLSEQVGLAGRGRPPSGPVHQVEVVQGAQRPAGSAAANGARLAKYAPAAAGRTRSRRRVTMRRNSSVPRASLQARACRRKSRRQARRRAAVRRRARRPAPAPWSRAGRAWPMFSNADSIPSETSTAERSRASTSACRAAVRGGRARLGDHVFDAELVGDHGRHDDVGVAGETVGAGPDGTGRRGQRGGDQSASLPPVRDSSTGTPRSPSGRTASTSAAATAS